MKETKLDLEGLEYHALSSGTPTPPAVREQILAACREIRTSRAALLAACKEIHALRGAPFTDVATADPAISADARKDKALDKIVDLMPVLMARILKPIAGEARSSVKIPRVADARDGLPDRPSGIAHVDVELTAVLRVYEAACELVDGDASGALTQGWWRGPAWERFCAAVRAAGHRPPTPGS